MSVLSARRVDTTSPVIAALITASEKSFTGSITYAGCGHEVIVYCEGGQIVAAHSPSFPPPVVANLKWRTGTDYTGHEHPFRSAYDDQRIDADVLDEAAREWAYGLLASALTWSKVKVSLNRKARAADNVFVESHWQRVSTDLSARVSDLVSSWGTISEYLQAQGLAPRNASHACSRLAVSVAGHPLFTGEVALDDLAAQTGQTRYAVLRELARTLLGQPDEVSFTVVQPVAAPGTVLVPESLEDPEDEWASLGAIGYQESATLPAAEFEFDVADEPATDTEETFEAADQGDAFAPADNLTDALTSIADTTAWPVETEPFDPEATELQALEPEPAAELVVAEPAPSDLDLGIVYTPAAPTQSSDHDTRLLGSWVAAASHDGERAVRQGVIAQTVAGATRQCEETLTRLDAVAQELLAAVDEQGPLDQAAAAAEQDLQIATGQVAVVQRDLDEAKAWADSVTAAEHAAETSAHQLAQASAEAREQLEAAREALLLAQETLESATEAEREGELEVKRLRDKVQGEVHETLSAARTSVAQATATLLTPAQVRADEARRKAEAGLALVREHGELVMGVGNEASVSVEVASSLAGLVAGSEDLVASLRARLDALRLQVLSAMESTSAAAEARLQEAAGELDGDGDDDEEYSGVVPPPMPAPTSGFDLAKTLAGMSAPPAFDEVVGGTDTGSLDEPLTGNWAPVSHEDEALAS